MRESGRKTIKMRRHVAINEYGETDKVIWSGGLEGAGT